MNISTSPNISNLDFDVLFDIAQPVPKAIITDISTYIGSGSTNIIGIVVRIVDPSNLQFTTTVYPPNVDMSVGLTSKSFNLPYYAGQVKWGTYKVYYELIDQDGTIYNWSDDSTGAGFKSIELCRPNSLPNAVNNWGGLNLSVNDNCDTGMLEVQDGGTGFSYNGVAPSETTASLTITYPIDTTGTTAQAVATFIPFAFPLTVAGIYSIVGTVTQTYDLTSTTHVKAAYYYQNTFDINCGYTLCKALCDYERLEADLASCTIKNPNEAWQQYKMALQVVMYLGKIAWFKQCGKKFGDVLAKLKEIGNFSCNCECNPQGIAPAPLFNSGNIVKGNMCGDIDMNLTNFMGNVKIDLSDISYSVAVATANKDYITFTPTEGDCSKQFTLSIDVCAMLGTVSIDCLDDVNTASPAPSDGDYLRWNATAGEWQPDSTSLPTLTWHDLASTSGNWTVATSGRLQYAKDFLGNVYLRGLITGTGLVSTNFYILATLPAGYRPSNANGETFIAAATQGSLIVAPSPAMVTILNTGQIFLTLAQNGTWNLSMTLPSFNVN